MKIRTSHQQKYIPVHKISLPQPLVSNLPAFHALTGCDTVSQFLGISKSSAWKVYQTNWFCLDGLGKEPLSEETLRGAEKFVCKLYSPATTIDSIDLLHHKLFLKGKKNPEYLPPSSNALYFHIRRAHYQTLIWLTSTTPTVSLPVPSEYGWQKDETSQTLQPTLMTKDAVPKQCVDIVFCHCKSCVTANCGCQSKGLRCTGSCSCSDRVR